MIDGREGQVTRAFADNSLADGADVVDLRSELTTRCAVMLDGSSAGALLADATGTLHVVGASSERTRNLELFWLQREDGPCSNCFREGAAVSVPDLSEAYDRLPHFAPAATEAGFASVHALLLRLRGPRSRDARVIGTTVGALTDEDRVLGQALAHVAGVALMQDRRADPVDPSHAHLRRLDSRSRLATETDSVVRKPAEGVRWWSGRRSVSRCCAPATRSCSRRPGLSRPSGFDGGGRGHVLHHARRRTACGGRR